MDRYFDRIAVGENIPVPDAATENFLPEVKKVLDRIASGAAAEANGPPAELSVSQLMQFDECPRRFFLREMLKFPDREVMKGLGLCPASGPDMEKKWQEAEAEPPVGSSKRRFGQLVHECLEHVDFLAGEQQDLRAITTRFLSSSDESSAAEELIRRFLRSEDARRLRNARVVHRELPAKAAVDNVIISGVIDVLYLNEDNRWSILDFKTGTEHAENSSLRSVYDFQMRLYAFLVSEATGVRPEKATVHFLRSGTSRLLSTSEEDVERTEKRIAEIIAAIARREFGRATGAVCGQCPYVAVCESRF